jgi:hypothetical protein
MEQEVSELAHSETPPVVDSELQVFHGLVQKVAVNSFIGFGQDPLCTAYSGRQIMLNSFVFASLAQVLRKGRYVREARTWGNQQVRSKAN